MNASHQGVGLKLYRCHKEVAAMKIEHVILKATIAAGCRLQFKTGTEITCDGDYLLKHNPLPGGYYVRYEDGYESFSPAGPFEKGYSEILGEITPDVSRETS